MMPAWYNVLTKAKGVATMTREEMIRMYALLAAAHKYIVGFTCAGYLYYTIYNGMIADTALKMDKASSKRGGFAKIRVRIDNKLKAAILNSDKAICIGPESLLDTDDKYNKGERFERIITEMLTGMEWKKDSIPFNIAGDIKVNGEEIQIKMDGAELTNERTLKKAA